MSKLDLRQGLMVLNALPGIGPVRVGRLLDAFGDAANVLQASIRELRQVRDIGPETASVISSWEEHFDLAAEERLLREHEAKFVPKNSDGYPRRLSQLPEAPHGLYMRGEIPQQPMIAMVGTRRPTLYGRQVAKRFASDLARAGFCIASGLARGVDGEAHTGALETGKTVAVLGCGLDVIYPPEHRDLYNQIACGGGAVVSEFSFGRKPDQQTFPQRNRLISGMSDAVLVVESDTRGGSMITARFAADQGRDVFAIPGRIDQSSARGCHTLIRDGATLVTSADDIIQEMNFMQLSLGLDDGGGSADNTRPQTIASPVSRIDPRMLGPDEQAVFAALADGAILHPESISRQAAVSHPAAMAALMMLELKRAVAKHPDGTYERVC